MITFTVIILKIECYNYTTKERKIPEISAILRNEEISTKNDFRFAIVNTVCSV